MLFLQLPRNSLAPAERLLLNPIILNPMALAAWKPMIAARFPNLMPTSAAAPSAMHLTERRNHYL